jgi:hypothetical protein
MKGILTDMDIEGQVRVLLTILMSDSWRDFWILVDLPFRTFMDVGLSRDVPDAVVWHLCQQELLTLITANRNATGPDSLEATLQMYNQPEHLPVFTIANPKRVLQSREYAERVTAKLLEYLLDIDYYRGAGRLYLP